MPRPQSYREGQTSTTQESLQSTRGSKVTGERVALLVVSALLAAAVIVVCHLAHANIITQDGFQRLKDELEALKKNPTEQRGCETQPCIILQPTCWKNETCWKCEEGWEKFGEKCYYFSTKKFPWSKSRAECQKQEGDLVKIDSREEQIFLDEKLRSKMKKDEDKFWIGLTDSEEEGTWLWADRSPLNQSLVFWNGDEPDNWKDRKDIEEDCGRMGEKGRDVNYRSWFDRSCTDSFKYICEKQGENGKLECVL
ncbi:C-type lectin domain family 4 member E-like [Halichoeres trimaculatus]|uniref:C-type lectin domain family 4 member E-like n=1 Tax=Halichoeres trimaculatus TaxID=147232 RepID=UPI003D9EE3F2